MTLRDFLNHFRKHALFCPECHSPMRRAERDGELCVECVRAPGCGGVRGLPVKYVEGRTDWREQYGGLLGRLGEIHQKFALVNEFVQLEKSQPQRTIDVGCAYGHYLRVLADLNPETERYAVDLSEDACRAVESEGLVKACFWQSVSKPIPLEEGSVDWMYSFDTIEHVPLNEMLERLFFEAARVLKPGGRFFLFYPNFNPQTKLFYFLCGLSGITIGGDHCNMLTAGDVMRLSAPYLQTEEIRFVGPVPIEWGGVPLLHSFFSPRLRIASNVFVVLRKVA